MPINALHHVTVKTDDLDTTRDFYREILGLEVGFRPELGFPGYWLYCGPIPVVHLVPRENAIGGGPSGDTGRSITSRFSLPISRGLRPSSNGRRSHTAKTTSRRRRLTSCSFRTTTM